MKWEAHPQMPGVFLVRAPVHADARGTFVKTFVASEFARAGTDAAGHSGSPFVEQYVSTSHRGVLRGMHFQLPPADLGKLVTCLAGKILDVFTDLRKGSPTFQKTFSLELAAETGISVYLPRGVAHGFLTLSDEAVVLYNTTAEYAPSKDAGIRWDSLGFSWPVREPILSARDLGFPALSDFQSPFEWRWA